MTRPSSSWLAATAAFALLTTSACGSSPAASAADADAAPAMPPGAVAVVHLQPSMTSSLHIDTLGPRDVPRALHATGKVALDESRVARVLAPVAGQVSALTVNVGDRVAAGDTLFNLESRDAASAIEDRLDAQKDLDLADKTMTMTQDLYDHQAASRLALDQASTDLAKARARLDRTESALTAMGLTAPSGQAPAARIPVTTPVSGSVLERHINNGQFVQPDPSPLLVVADLSTVWVEADVFETDLRLLHAGEVADTTTTAYPDEHFRAHVSRISDVVDPATRTVHVRFDVANPDQRLKPEMFATVTLFLDTLEQAMTLPASAILTEGDRDYVYVAIDDKTFARRPVDVSVEADNSRRVLSGLSAGDRVVTTGAILLRGEEDRGAN